MNLGFGGGQAQPRAANPMIQGQARPITGLTGVPPGQAAAQGQPAVQQPGSNNPANFMANLSQAPQTQGQPAQGLQQGGAQSLGFGGPQGGSQQQVGSNPYLQGQAQAIISQSNQNLQNNILPGINSGAMAAGGYGGSRQGIAQGLAIQGQQQSLNNALANLYGQSYQNDQNNANQLNIANVGAAAQRYGADASAKASMYGADKSSAASMYGANKSAEAAKYGADSSAATAARGQDLNYQIAQQQNALGYAGLQNTANIANAGNATQVQVAGMNNATQTGIANMQNATTLNGQNLNYNLGMAQNSTAQRGQDLNYQVGMTNAYNTANGQMMNFYTNNRQLDQSGTRLGMDMVTAANLGYLGQGQGIYNLGLTAGNQAWSPYTNFAGVTNPYTGFGTTTSNNNGSAGAGFLGGAIAGGQLYNLINGKTATTATAS